MHDETFGRGESWFGVRLLFVVRGCEQATFTDIFLVFLDA